MGMGFICKQPNEKFCRYSHVTESFTHINFTEEDYLNGNINDSMSLESRKDTLDNHIHPILEAIRRLSLLNYAKKDLKIELVEIGFPETMAKYIAYNLNKFKGDDKECTICICTRCVNKCTYPCASCDFDEKFKPVLKCDEFLCLY